MHYKTLKFINLVAIVRINKHLKTFTVFKKKNCIFLKANYTLFYLNLNNKFLVSYKLKKKQNYVKYMNENYLPFL